MSVTANLLNETDVREDIAMPMLTALGYARGTDADIIREWSLAYDREFLGRKKAADPVLRGRADYVLSVLGAGRWVLEIKGPNEPIDLNSMDQAITYGRHPHVSAHYAAVLNGRRFVLLSAMQKADDPPLLDLAVASPKLLAEELRGILSPLAIRRDCSPPKVDIGRPLAPHLRSKVLLGGGNISHDLVDFVVNLPIPPAALDQLEDQRRRLVGMRVPVVGGEVWRDDASRILARIEWDAPHELLVAFGRSKGLFDQRFVCLDEEISTESNRPTAFDVIGSVSFEEGEPLFNIAHWAVENAALPGHMTYRGHAEGWLDGRVFKGQFDAAYLFTSPRVPGFEMETYLAGSFSISIDER